MFANNPNRTLQWPAQMELPLRYGVTSPTHDTPHQLLMDEHLYRADRSYAAIPMAILVEAVQHE